MDEALRKQWLMTEQDRQISEAVNREQNHLRNFIRKRVADPSDAEDILQEVFYELVEAYRMMQPVQQVTAWLFQVARHRIIDLFRRKNRDTLQNEWFAGTEDGQDLRLEYMLPSRDAGPEAAYVRSILAEELDAALDELPDTQREAFVAHELVGFSFKELSAKTGVSVNTLLSRKHYAVQYLRERLQAIYEEFREV